jgi:heme-degrading monooxygenase HmoA
LRGDAEGEYISHSSWASRDAFMAWMQSPAFAAGHRGSSMMGIVAGPPQVKLYDSVIATEFAPVRA